MQDTIIIASKETSREDGQTLLSGDLVEKRPSTAHNAQK